MDHRYSYKQSIFVLDIEDKEREQKRQREGFTSIVINKNTSEFVM